MQPSAYMFNDSRIRRINSIVNSNKKNRVTFEFHMMWGQKEDKTLINEMVGMVRGSMFVQNQRTAVRQLICRGYARLSDALYHISGSCKNRASKSALAFIIYRQLKSSE